MKVVYQDEVLAVLNKPAGVPTLPERFAGSGRDVLTWARQHLHPAAVVLHRLDRPTSGLLTLTWDKEVFRALYAQFAHHTVEKKYWALVHGEPDFEAAELTAPIGGEPPKIDPRHGKPALTIAHTIEHFRGYALVTCVPATGRTHQVRLHLSYYGFPIVGDEKYGGRPLYLSSFRVGYKPSRRRPERPLHEEGVIFLHAGFLSFFHPLRQQKLIVEAELPSHFMIALQQLRRWAVHSSFLP